jgi:hypothetical protein
MTISFSLLHIEERHKGQSQKDPDISGHSQDTKDKKGQAQTILDKNRQDRTFSDIPDRDSRHKTETGDTQNYNLQFHTINLSVPQDRPPDTQVLR